MDNTNVHYKSGFSLIEILVATFILVLIVAMMGAVFHQSSLAWDAGLRKAEGTMKARSVLGIMARKIGEARVLHVDGARDWDMVNGASDVEFYTADADADGAAGRRGLQKIEFRQTGTDVEMETIEIEQTDGAVYGQVAGKGEISILAEGIEDLLFYTSDGADHGGRASLTNLPQSLTIVLRVPRTDRVSGLGVRSFGPNAQDDSGKKDDITSWSDKTWEN